MAQIRANRQKHDLFYFTADEIQNAIVRKAVINWYNPISHERNRRWDAMRKQRRALEPPQERRADPLPDQRAEEQGPGGEPSVKNHGLADAPDRGTDRGQLFDSYSDDDA